VSDRRRLSTDGNITYTSENVKALLESLDPFIVDMIVNAFDEKQNQVLQLFEDFNTPANPPEEHRNVFFGKTRFLLQDKFRSGPSLNERIDAAHKEHAERKASRDHHKYIENIQHSRRLISSHMEQLSHHRRRLTAAAESCDENAYNCAAKELDDAARAIEDAFEVEVFYEIRDAIEKWNETRDTVDEADLSINLVWIGFTVASKLPYVGPPIKVATDTIIKKMKDFAGKLDK